MDYSNLLEVTVKNQQELDQIPLDFKGRIYIECTDKVIVKSKYYSSAVAWGNSSVVAWDNSSVVARDNSTVVAWDDSSVMASDNSTVMASDNSTVMASDNSTVMARDNSSVEALNNSTVVAWDDSSVMASDNSTVMARDNSSVEALNNSTVMARDNGAVVAWGNSSVEAWDNSAVEAWDNSAVEAYANVQVVDRQINGKIFLNGNARKVFMPKTIDEFMDFYGIKRNKTKAIFYKAVIKKDGVLYADHDNSFKYEVGKTATVPGINTDVNENCVKGIHIAHLDWCLRFGKNWDNLAIIEVETAIEDIVFPENSDGKVETSKVEVLREVPLSECGIYGKILEKRSVK